MAENDDKELKTIKFQMMLSPGEAREIDDWSFSNRIRSRAEAIRRLCQMGIIGDEKKDILRDGMNVLADQLIDLGKRIRAADLEESNGVDRAYHEVIIPFAEVYKELVSLGIGLNVLAEGESISESMKEARDILSDFKKQVEDTKE